MATSGVTTLTYTGTELVEEILEVMQALGDGESISGTMNKKVIRAINLFLKRRQTDGGHLWTYTEGTLFLQKGESDYDFATAKLTNTYFETTSSSFVDVTGASVAITPSATSSKGLAMAV